MIVLRSRFSTSKKSICDPDQLITGDTFYTTNGAFEYTVGQTTAPAPYSNGPTSLISVDGWFYSGESLASLCWGPDLALAEPWLYLVIDGLQKSVDATVRNYSNS
jgi:hypothetical protein